MSRRGIMLAYPFEEKRLLKWTPPYIVQPKLDGVRCRYQGFGGDTSFLLSSEENPIWGVPHIKDWLDSTIEGNYHLDGELYLHGMNFEDIVSITSRENSLHSEFQSLEYHIFDVIAPGLLQSQRLQILNSFEPLFKHSPIKIVKFYLASNLEEVMRCYDQILNEGYEGIVLREWNNLYIPRRSTSLMKFKPKKQDEYEVVGYTQEISIHGEPKESLGALVCKGDDGTRFNVGTGFTREKRELLWKNREYLAGSICVVSYQHLTHGAGVPRFPVFVKVI